MLNFLVAGIVLVGGADPEPKTYPKANGWKKTVIDKVFRSEGVAVADVNRDGKMDIINGEAWYEAPTWKMHEFRKLGDYGMASKVIVIHLPVGRMTLTAMVFPM